MNEQDEKDWNKLGNDCGPHCTKKDGVTGHCPECHRIKSLINDCLDAHRNGRSFVARLEC